MINKLPDKFCVFILTHGRPDNIATYQTLIKAGYSGKAYFVVDDTDKTKSKYIERFGNKVIIFNKMMVAKTFDKGDNFGNVNSVVYARNACFGIAEKLGIKYFIELDDDYTKFAFRFDSKLDYCFTKCRNIDLVFTAMIKFFLSSKASSIALSQGGDFIGGKNGDNDYAHKIRLTRKCMNSFLCSTERPFCFIGNINEDVNTYTRLGSVGLQMFTINQVSLNQKQTQSAPGGMTEIYLDSGTYVKSFYSVMYQPSSVKIKMTTSRNKRLHHSVLWNNTVPKIVSEDLRRR